MHKDANKRDTYMVTYIVKPWRKQSFASLSTLRMSKREEGKGKINK